MNKILNKKENQILIMLAFFSISIGIWGNFRQLWLQDNGFNISQISIILSLGTFVSVLGIIFVGKFISLNRLKNIITVSICIKFFDTILLYFCNKTGLSNYITLFTVIDIIAEYIVITSIYPLITTITKSNTIYSKRKLTEYLFEDIGILIAGIIIGKTILGIVVDYNICLIISDIFLLISILMMLRIKPIKVETKIKEQSSILKYILKDKIIVTYLFYGFLAGVAISTGLGLKILVLKNFFNFTDSSATTYILIVELIGDIFGILALKYMTPKNDYLTITIKFGIRFIEYCIAFISDNLLLTFIAITWSLFIGPAYENICDGPYINSVKDVHQLKFTNLRYIVKFLGESVGIFFCGLMYEIGLRYIFGLSAFFMIFQLVLAYKLIYMRNHNRRIICKRNPQIKYKERKCVYAILYDNDGNIAITNDGKYFFFGGGREGKEKELETLEREMLEETGYTIKDIELFDRITSYEYNSSRGNLKIVATIYLAKLNKKVVEPIEKDHPILWGRPEEYINKMYHKYQRVMIKEYIEKYNKEKEVEEIC